MKLATAFIWNITCSPSSHRSNPSQNCRVDPCEACRVLPTSCVGTKAGNTYLCVPAGMELYLIWSEISLMLRVSSINIKPSVLNFRILNEQGSPRVSFASAPSQFVGAQVEAAMYLDNVICIQIKYQCFCSL